MRRFENKVAIVTGGASGIGFATALRLGSEGARIVIADVDPSASSRTGEITGAGAPDAVAFACDVGQEGQVERTVADTMSRFGRLDIVVNNAAVMTFKPIVELTAAEWLRVLGINLIGPAHFLRAAFRSMREGGAVVNVASIHAERTSKLVAPYAASKAAMLSLTRSAALEGRELQIRVNAVEPGAIDTPLLWSNPNVQSGQEKIEAADVGKPDDVAAAVAYLASAEAAFITGACLRVDGGRLARL
ncbi:MAG: glucose 1-dehydrogenase [Hyphomicrobiaceae bacterium]|nr:glucose 1-dehydrogenase [Hyphomicrobiaceae bacterium]